MHIDRCPPYVYNTSINVEVRKTSVTGRKRGNAPVKGFAAEIRLAVSAAAGLVLGITCPGLSRYVERYRWFCIAIAAVYPWQYFFCERGKKYEQENDS